MNEDINKKMIELKMKAHLEDVKLQIQRLAQLADNEKEEIKKQNNDK
jgi:hypothetical protein